MGKIFTCSRIQMTFGLNVCLKPCNDRGEFEFDFEFDRVRSKINMAENSSALASETHNT